MKTKNNKKGLSSAQKQLSSILDTQNELVCRFRPDTVLTYVNDAYCRAFGRTKKELLGKPFLSLIPENDHQFVRSNIASLSPAKPSITYEHQVNTHDKGVRWQEWTDSVVAFHEGKILEIQSVGHDITERKVSELGLKEAKEKAAAASEAKSQFLANMSHEIRTPLNAVVGCIGLLKNTPLNDTQSEYLKHARVAAQSLLSIITNILDFSKIEAGKLDLDLADTDILKTCNDATKLLRFHAESKKILLFFNQHPGTPRRAIIDQVKLKQILVNLLANAIKFTEEGEVELSVEGRVEDDQAVYAFAVRDTGIGISEEARRDLFEAFQQADTSITRKYGGTGLGLTISNLLANMMGSQINIQSTPGKGSTFSFTLRAPLPTSERTKPEASFQSVPVVKTTLEHPRILIVDDEEISRVILDGLLREMVPRAIISQATNGEEAIEMLRDRHHDLVILDIRMPDMDGFEFTRRIRSLAPGNGQLKKPAICAITASAVKEYRDRCLEAGMDEFLAKPVSEMHLAHILKTHL